MKMAVFWVVALCSIVALMMEAARTSETLVHFYQTTWCYNPEDSHLNSRIFSLTFCVVQGLCHQIAKEKGISHGQLPIGEFLEMKTRKVLTIDHGKWRDECLSEN
jgi:hypothetical protein